MSSSDAMHHGAPLVGDTDRRRSQGIVLAIVLVLIFVLITAVYAFQRRAIINTSIAQNRLAASEADALARGGLRIAEAVVFVLRLKEIAGDSPQESADDDPASGLLASLASSGDLWAQIGDVPLELDGQRSLRIEIEDEGARLNLNALVPQSGTPAEGEEDENEAVTSTDSYEDAEQYLVEVLQHIVAGMEGRPEEKNYDERAIARNLIDYMDPDDTALDGRSEDAYYRDQDPPYRARNGPFLGVEEIGMVEGVDPRLLEAMRDYVTVYPIGGTEGINLNRAEPWVLSLVYAGPSGDRELLSEQDVRDLFELRRKGKIVCQDSSADPVRCVSLREVGNGALGEGSIYPEVSLPSTASVFRVVAEAQVGNLTRRFEAIFDTRPAAAPQVLSWRRLRGTE